MTREHVGIVILSMPIDEISLYPVSWLMYLYLTPITRTCFYVNQHLPWTLLIEVYAYEDLVFVVAIDIASLSRFSSCRGNRNLRTQEDTMEIQSL